MGCTACPPAPSLRAPRRLPGILLAGLLAGLSGCDSGEAPPESVVRPVRVVTVEKNEGSQMVQLAGTVESQVEVDLGFRIGGRMVERLVRVGDVVEPGQLVARLDPTDEENGLRAAEASLAAVEGQLSEARLDYERQRHLYERRVAARVAFERAEQVFSTAQAAVDAANAQAGIARRRLDDTELHVDAPGVVTAIGAEPGEVVQAGRMIAQIARDDGKDAVFNVPAGMIEASPGDPEVTVSLSQNSGVTAKGRVREVAPRADTVTGTFLVRVGLIDPPAEMRLGSTVVGRANFGGASGIELPASALTRTEGEPAVWVVDPSSKTVALRRIGVERFAPAAVVVSDGLQVGEIVVTAGVQALRPGQEVRLLGEAP
ncbi:MAG: efflux RND transporter periplasmic adaptor subunit [Methyloceanibacter sp.]